MGAAGPTAVVGLGVALTQRTAQGINARVNGRVNQYSAVMTVSVPPMTSANSISLTASITPTTGIVEIDRLASTITPTISWGGSVWPITLNANQALSAGGSITYSASLNGAGAIDFTATPTFVRRAHTQRPPPCALRATDI